MWCARATASRSWAAKKANDFGILKNERKSHTRDGSRQHNALAVPLFLTKSCQGAKEGRKKNLLSICSVIPVSLVADKERPMQVEGSILKKLRREIASEGKMMSGTEKRDPTIPPDIRKAAVMGLSKMAVNPDLS